MLSKTKTAAAALAAAALVVTGPVGESADAHHRDADRWERDQAHHHGPWIYKTDKRVAHHRHWHRWYLERDRKTRRRHPGSPALRVESTAYCMSGRMANGQYARDGAAAMNGVPLGTKFRVMTGPLHGDVVTVKDRIGSGSDFDVAMPGRCSRAYKYGRRTINIRRVT